MISEGKADLGGRFGYCGFYCMKILACNDLSCKSCMGPEGLEGLTCWETISCRLGFKLVAFLFQPEGIGKFEYSWTLGLLPSARGKGYV